MICIAFMAKVTAVHIVAIEQITFALWHFKISCSTVYPYTKNKGMQTAGWAITKSSKTG